MKVLCPICGEGELHEIVEFNEHTYRGVTGKNPLFYSECDSCGSETATPDQLRKNKQVFLTFKRLIDEQLESGSTEE